MKLSQGINLYVQHKWSAGFEFVKARKTFEGFCRFVGDIQLSEVRASDLLRFIDGPKTSRVTFRHKYGTFKHLFEFLVSRELIQDFTMPPNRPTIRQNFTPFIYTRQQIRSLLVATRYKNPWAFNQLLSAPTMRTFLLSLYATGALVGEMINLKSRDVLLGAGTITIHSHRFGRTRRLPLSADLMTAFTKYDRVKKRKGLEGEFFFLKDDGTVLNGSSLNSYFQRLRLRAGVLRTDGATYQPRMHDLRSTFAVHRITSWIKNKADLNKMLPALAVYMGQSGLASTERYFYLTPERFRTDLERLMPSERHRRWRDDPKLIAFLSGL